MPPKLGSEGAEGRRHTSKVRDADKKALGKIYPNLVVIRDSGLPHVEFRVQCEVELQPEEGDRLDALLRHPRSPETLAQAKRLVVSRVHPSATARFRQIVDLAFEDQVENS